MVYTISVVAIVDESFVVIEWPRIHLGCHLALAITSAWVHIETLVFLSQLLAILTRAFTAQIICHKVV